MDDRKFDELLSKAVTQRCSGQLPENLIHSVNIKIRHNDRGIVWRLERRATVAAAVTAIVVTALIKLLAVESQNTSYDAPPFYVDAYDVTKSRLDESSSVSRELRDDINELYSDIRP